MAFERWPKSNESHVSIPGNVIFVMRRRDGALCVGVMRLIPAVLGFAPQCGDCPYTSILGQPLHRGGAQRRSPKGEWYDSAKATLHYNVATT